MSIFKRKPRISFSYITKDVLINGSGMDPSETVIFIKELQKVFSIAHETIRSPCVKPNEMRFDLAKYCEKDAYLIKSLYREAGIKMTFDNDTRTAIQDVVDRSKAMFTSESDGPSQDKIDTLIENSLKNNVVHRPIFKATSVVWDYVHTHLDITDDVQFTLDDVYIVWFCYILGGWKALCSTTFPDGMYYEVVYNFAKKEIYLDAYKKFQNVCVPD